MTSGHPYEQLLHEPKLFSGRWELTDLPTCAWLVRRWNIHQHCEFVKRLLQKFSMRLAESRQDCADVPAHVNCVALNGYAWTSNIDTKA